jgi:hypothetical protein
MELALLELELDDLLLQHPPGVLSFGALPVGWPAGSLSPAASGRWHAPPGPVEQTLQGQLDS